MKYLRQANLDAFWGRRPGTIRGYMRLYAQQLEAGEAFGIEMFNPLGPIPYACDMGIRSALGVLWKSELPGKHELKQKYASVRRVRTIHTHLFDISPGGITTNLVLKNDRKRWVATAAPSESEWHSLFMLGYHARVGERQKHDATISLEQMMAIQDLLEERWRDARRVGCPQMLRDVAEVGAFFMTGYCGSLRGFEVPKLVLTELRNQLHLEATPYVPAHIGLPLHGRFKARGSALAKVLVLIVPTTASGLCPGKWLERLVDVLDGLGIKSGWLFQDEEGTQQPLNYFEEEFYSVLHAIRDRDPSLFEPGVDIYEDYQLARSLRRGATTRATEAGVSQPDIDWMNRWNTGGAEIINGPMHVIYSERKQLLKTYLRFSAAL